MFFSRARTLTSIPAAMMFGVRLPQHRLDQGFLKFQPDRRSTPRRSYGFTPHNGLREQSRRLRQEIMKIAKSKLELDEYGRSLGTLWDQLRGDEKSYSDFRQADVKTLLEIREYVSSARE